MDEVGSYICSGKWLSYRYLQELQSMKTRSSADWELLAMSTRRCQISLFLLLSPFSICSACTDTHLEFPGAHIPVSMKKPRTGPLHDQKEVCDECSAKPAVMFCL